MIFDQRKMPQLPRLGVAICTYNSSDVIVDCLETLLASSGVALEIVVVDNASTDATVDLLRTWAKVRNWTAPEDCPFSVDRCSPLDEIDPETGTVPNSLHRLRLIEARTNLGFAAGVNTALSCLLQDPTLDRFWILNPDCLIPPGTAHAFAREPSPPGGFSLMGGRVLYCDGTDRIQIDGGILVRTTGVTKNINQLQLASRTPPTDPKQMDFVTGASMVASRQFISFAGPIPEDYFLYYEEVDWAMRRGSMPLAYCPSGTVYHRAGTAIGSPTPSRRASLFSLYFKHRSRMIFVRRYLPKAIWGALVFSIAKTIQLTLLGQFREAVAVSTGSLGLQPSRSIKKRLSTATLDRLGFK